MPIRMLRDWTDSESVNSLSANAEVLFVRLIMKADDYGRFHGNVKLMRSLLFPLRDGIRDADMSRWMAECQKVGLLRVYQAADKPFIEIRNFGQRMRQSVKKFPDPVDEPSAESGQLPAESGDSPQVAAGCGKPPQVAASGGLNGMETETGIIKKDISSEISKEKQEKETTFTIPEILKSQNGFIEAWSKWMEYRKTHKNKVKNLNMLWESHLKILAEYPEMATQMINYSISGGYPTFYPPKNFNRSMPSSNKKSWELRGEGDV